MADELRVEIEQWFDDHEDGDFLRVPRTSSFSVSDSTPDSHAIIYTTKSRSTNLLVERYCGETKPGIVGCYGLPHEDDVTKLRDVVGDRRLGFLGDCDPPDVLIFSWLRSYFEITHFGVNDDLASELQVPVGDNLTIEQSESEANCLPLVKRICPDIASLVGRQCGSLMDRKRKLEIEALVSFATATGPVLDDVFEQRRFPG